MDTKKLIDALNEARGYIHHADLCECTILPTLNVACTCGASAELERIDAVIREACAEGWANTDHVDTVDVPVNKEGFTSGSKVELHPASPPKEEREFSAEIIHCSEGCLHSSNVDCHCYLLAGLDPKQVGYPPYHTECTCYVDKKVYRPAPAQGEEEIEKAAQVIAVTVDRMDRALSALRQAREAFGNIIPAIPPGCNCESCQKINKARAALSAISGVLKESGK